MTDDPHSRMSHTDDPCDEWPVWLIPGVMASYIAEVIKQVMPGNVMGTLMERPRPLGKSFTGGPITVHMIPPTVMGGNAGPEAILPLSRICTQCRTPFVRTNDGCRRCAYKGLLNR
jgi:hypothetical protein